MTADDQVARLFERHRELEARPSTVPLLAQRLQDLREWQATRLAQTYQDLRRDPQFSQAVKFFLSDLYGQDFARRNLELSRVWRYLKNALPAAAVKVLEWAIELETLTLELDQAMLVHLPAGPISRSTYTAAYGALGQPEKRQHQIDLIIEIGEQLSRVAKRPLISLALRSAHAPAHAAGFGVLQDFLERGLAAFRSIRDAGLFLQTIRQRETRLLQTLLVGSEEAFDAQ
jgi:hypothetical protein